MNFGTWYLAPSVDGGAQKSGPMHPVGICELSHQLAAMAGSPGLIVDMSDIDVGFFDSSAFFGILARVRNAGGHVVVVSGPGPLTRFLNGVALANPVSVVASLLMATALGVKEAVVAGM
jgi:hypothetical protein